MSNRVIGQTAAHGKVPAAPCARFRAAIIAPPLTGNANARKKPMLNRDQVPEAGMPIHPVTLMLPALAVILGGGAGPAQAQRIENQIAVFAALDKVTARISKLEANLGETVKFGSLKLTPRVCYSRPPTEQPKTTAFIEVDETELNGRDKRLFSGWMFAESPGLNAVEHPVFDVWLTECRQPVKPPGQTAAAPKAGAPAEPAGATAAPDLPAEPRRRVRR